MGSNSVLKGEWCVDVDDESPLTTPRPCPFCSAHHDTWDGPLVSFKATVPLSVLARTPT